jgi:hypothetical protein
MIVEDYVEVGVYGRYGGPEGHSCTARWGYGLGTPQIETIPVHSAGPDALQQDVAASLDVASA